MTDRYIPTAEEVRKVLRYDAETGKLYWLPRPGFTSIEKEAFTSTMLNGYKQGAVLAYPSLGHRVAWLLHYGYWPKEVDHINGVRTDNRISNLREVDRSINNRNRAVDSRNKSGVSGVDYRLSQKKWRARVTVRRQTTNLGMFDTFEEAVEARRKAEATHGYHPNHGRSKF